uniref:Uncharacterized protein n=2 Tax=Clytia hemisphaerica TaxID=252671 RepID=A0A7M5V0M4_9CNID
MIQSPSDYNVIFAGDMNLRDYEVQNIGGLPVNITDAWEAMGKNPATEYTFDLKLNDNKCLPNNPRKRFDRMYYKRAESNTVQCVGFELVGLERLPCGMFTSDHFGMLGKFAFLDF